MFSVQRKFYQATHPCSREEFYEVVGSAEVAQAIDAARECLRQGDQKGYSARKKALPLFIFMSEIMPNTSPDTKGNARPEARWRVQEAARLNGLVMADFDLKENPETMKNPKGFWQQFVERHSHWLDTRSHHGAIYLAHITPSGQGLRVVFAADVRCGNLYDNVQKMALVLGLKSDASCKDASRGSFACKKDDILYINDDIFNYENEVYDRVFGDLYRSGKSSAVPAAAVKEKTATAQGETADEGEKKPLTYHGVAMERIAEAWQIENPVTETRHGNMLEAASDLRYLVESPEELAQAMMLVNSVREIVSERGEKEVQDAAATAWSGPRYKRVPKRVAKVLLRAGVKLEERKQMQDGEDEKGNAVCISALDFFGKRMKPLLAPPYDVVCQGMDECNFLPAVFAAGTMFCTLMTRCTYIHYDGEEHRMNPQALIIGPPSSGKSFADRLNKEIMAVLRAQDSVARNALKEYKRKRKERATSSKEQKLAALVEPQGMIRVLLSNTSNNQFYKRLVNAHEEVDGELMPLHVYMFDSELASANKANGGADWIGKRDMELKAFHNEEAGSDYANEDSVNDFVPVLWNTVTTGTKIALAKKFTLANINDGLCTRVAIAPMAGNEYQMIARGNSNRNHDRELRLKEWGFFFDRQHGLLPVQKLVEHTYELCDESAWEAEVSSDKVLDTLRRRAVFYAQWFTIPRIVARLRQEDGSGQQAIDAITVTDEDLRWATLIYEAVIYWQDYFFGQMLQESWENGARMFQPRKKKTRNAELYAMLPEEFDVNDAGKVLAGVSETGIRKQLSRWEKAGYTKRIKYGCYKKIIKQII